MLHFPVLLEESIDFLVNDINGHYIDCTFGRGGHSKLILEKLSKDGLLTGIDKDPDACGYAMKFQNDNFKIINDSFNNICLLYTSPSPRDMSASRMPSSA